MNCSEPRYSCPPAHPLAWNTSFQLARVPGGLAGNLPAKDSVSPSGGGHDVGNRADQSPSRSPSAGTWRSCRPGEFVDCPLGSPRATTSLPSPCLCCSPFLCPKEGMQLLRGLRPLPPGSPQEGAS